jgi:ABC-2 type transport system permease protein
MIATLYGFKSVAYKEMLHLHRDPTTLVFAIIIPLIQLLMFGYAVDFDVRHIPTVVVDNDRSMESRDYIASLQNTQYLRVIGYVDTPDQAVADLRQNSAKVAVIIPPDFGWRVAAKQEPTVRVLIDGSDSPSVAPARSAFVVPPQTLDPSQVEPRIDILYNPDIRTQIFTIPGLVGVVLQLVTIALTSFSLVREREQGSLEQLMVSPVGKLGLLLGKLAPYAVLAMAEIVFVLIMARILFNIQVMGSVVLLFVLSAPFVLAALSLGLLISTFAQTQGQALQVTMLTTLPSILLSGYVAPRETQPGIMQVLGDCLPVTYYIQILRAIIVRGAGLADVWPNVIPLLLISTVLLSVASMRFRKSIQ